MLRRTVLSTFVLLPFSLRLRASENWQRIRGRLRQDESKPPALVAQAGGTIEFEGDEDSLKVVRDPRLQNDDFEALGHPLAGNRFKIAPIHERALFVYRSGKRLVITYWCPVCAIRAWAPGPCQCCQAPTELDPRDPALKDTDPSD